MNKTTETMHQIWLCIAKKHGCAAADYDIQALQWYIPRCSATFLRLFNNCKPYMVARRLHAGGSIEEQIGRIQRYLGYNPA
jgi:hypothetical protein